MGLFNKKERDIGVCAILICPHCQTVSRFTLRQVSAAFVLYGLRLFDVDRCYQLFCGLCKYRKALDSRELLPAMRAKRLYVRLEAGEITPVQYLEALDALKFPSLRALRTEAKTWTCPNCTEKVPEGFDRCWKCNAQRPELQSTIPTEKSG
jgi:hypothetical protein